MSFLHYISNVCRFGVTFLHKVLITGYTLKWFVVETTASDLKKSCKTLINFEYSKIYAFTPFSCIIAYTRQTGGSLRAISPCYRPASKGAGFLFVQALLSLPLLLAPSRGYITLRRDLHTPSHLIYPGLCHAFLVLLYIFLWFLH